MWQLSMLGDNNCPGHNDDIFDINDSIDNCSDFCRDRHHCFNFNHRDDNDNVDNDNGNNDNGDNNNKDYDNNDKDDNDNNVNDYSNDDFGNHNSDNHNNINRASDNDHDSIHALDNQLDAILHCFGSQYMEISK